MGERISVHVQSELLVLVPRPPNFLRYGQEAGLMMDVADLPDGILRQVGEAWTQQLIERAAKRRKGEVSDAK